MKQRSRVVFIQFVKLIFHFFFFFLVGGKAQGVYFYTTMCNYNIIVQRYVQKQ